METYSESRKMFPHTRVYSPLIEALLRGDAKHIKMLLKIGMNPNQRDAIQRTPLIIITHYKDENKAKLLAEEIINCGGKIQLSDAKGMNAVHHVCQKGKIKLAELLLQYKDDYDVFVKDGSGKTCLDYAEMTENKALMRILNNIAIEFGLVFHKKKGSFAEESPSLRNHEKLHNEAAVTKNGDNKDLREDLKGEEFSPRKNGRSVHNDKKHKSVSAIRRIHGPCREGFCSRQRGSDSYIGSHRASSLGLKTDSPNEDVVSSLRKVLKQDASKDKDIASTESSKKRGSSKELLVKIYKLYEKQTSATYREAAKRPIIEDLCERGNTESPTLSISPLPDSTTPGYSSRPTSRRNNRSMSLVPGAMTNLLSLRSASPSTMHSPRSARQRRFSTAITSNDFSIAGGARNSLQGEDLPKRPNSLRQRRFSALSATNSELGQNNDAGKSNPLQMNDRMRRPRSLQPRRFSSLTKVSTRPELNDTSSNILSLSAPNLTAIKEYNEERKAFKIGNYGSEDKSSEKDVQERDCKSTSGGLRRTISTLPTLQTFAEKEESQDSS